MKKFLLSAALLAACGMANAQKITFVPFGEGESANAFLEATAISDNGRYVGGGTGEYAFIVDMETMKIKTFISPDLVAGDEEADSDVKSISNDGVGYGYVGDKSAKFDYATGKYTTIDEDKDGVIYYTSADGAVQTGVYYDKAWKRTPLVYVDGKAQYLPIPKESTLGFEIGSGVGAMMASGNGDVIIGDLGDDMSTYPLVIWQKNADDATYSLVPVCKRFFNQTFVSWQPYDLFNGAAISQNGKWIALNLHKNMPIDSWDDEGQFIARYDVEADTIQIISCPDANDVYYYYANGISNDGTIVGTINDLNTQSSTGMICEAGSTEAKDIADVFPSVKEFATMDGYNNNTPCAITPDGRYIVGFGYKESPNDPETLWYASWRLDTQASETGVENATTANEASKVVASYNLEGQKLNNPKANRFVINRLANGKSVKRVVK